MTPERWRRVEELYRAALERDTRDRALFLEDACAGDDALRREVESLLAQPASAAAFLGEPAVVLAARLERSRPVDTTLAIESARIRFRPPSARAAWVSSTARSTRS